MNIARSYTGSSAAVAAIAVALLSGCGDSMMPPEEGPTPATEIAVRDNRFTPAANAIDVGETVTWTWGGNNPHNVTFDDAAIGNSNTQVAGAFERTFGEAGEYTYFCTVHGRAVMSGRVVVGG